MRELERLLAEVKDGRVLSAANLERLQAARDLLDTVLVKHQGGKHLPGRHDQSTHGRGGGMTPRPGMGDVKITEDTAAAMAGGSAAPHLVKDADGNYSFTPERQALHDKIVNDALAGVPVSDNPTYYMTGGGPASGKSRMLEAGNVDVPTGRAAVQVNADDVKAELPEYRGMVAAGDANAAYFSHEESSYIAQRIQSAGMERGMDVVLDGTADSGADKLQGKIDTARARGYRVVANYATVPTDVAVAREQARAARTGRKVSEDVVRTTHRNVSAVFPQVATSFDEVNLWDTSSTPKLLARGRQGRLDIIDQEGYDAFLAKAGE